MASMNTPIVPRLHALLSARQFPKTICPSEVARALSQADIRDILRPEDGESRDANEQSWRDVMPAIRAVVWQMRDRGEVEILQHGEALSADVGVDSVRGPIRVRWVETRLS